MDLQPCHLAQLKKNWLWMPPTGPLECRGNQALVLTSQTVIQKLRALCASACNVAEPSREHLAQAPSKLTLQCTSEAQEVIQIFIGKDPIRVCVPHGWAPLCNLRPHHLQPHRIFGIVLLLWPFLSEAGDPVPGPYSYLPCMLPHEMLGTDAAHTLPFNI